MPDSFSIRLPASYDMEVLRWMPQEEYKRGSRAYDDIFIGVERIHEYVLRR